MTNGTDQQLARVSLRDALFIVFSKKRVFQTIFIAIVVVTNLVALVADPIYEVAANILVKPAIDATLRLQTPVGALRGADPVSPQDINSEISIILSNELLRTVVESLDLQAEKKSAGLISNFFRTINQAKNFVLIKLGLSYPVNPVDEAAAALKGKLKVKPVTMSNIIEISMTGSNPKKITTIINTVADRFIDRHIQVRQEKGGVSFFRTEVVSYQQKLSEAENALQEFQKKWSIIDVDAQRKGNLAILTLLRENLSLLKGKIAEQEARTSRTKEEMDAWTKDYIENPILNELTRAMIPLIVERERVATLYPKSSPEFVNINNQVKELQQATKNELARIITGVEIDMRAANKQKESLERTIEQIEQHSQFLTEKEVELNRLNRELKLNEKTYLLYQEKEEESRIDNQKDTSRVANVIVSSWAHEPTVPIFPKKLLMGFLSLVMGLIVGIAGAFVAYYMDHTVKLPEDLPRYAEIPVLCAVQQVGSPKKAA